MSDGKKRVGQINFTRQIPNFLQSMSQRDDTGIDGAIRRHAERAEPEEREDNDDEKPIVVSEVEALTSKQRKGSEAAASKSNGSLRFKNDSVASRFQESAHERVLAAEAAQDAAQAEDAQGSTESRHVFSATSTKRGSSSSAKKRKSTDGVVGAKALKNKSLLSFDDDE
jgi:hypothetical protein